MEIVVNGYRREKNDMDIIRYRKGSCHSNTCLGSSTNNMDDDNMSRDVTRKPAGLSQRQQNSCDYAFLDSNKLSIKSGQNKCIKTLGHCYVNTTCYNEYDYQKVKTCSDYKPKIVRKYKKFVWQEAKQRARKAGVGRSPHDFVPGIKNELRSGQK